jgi:hypothetical protein
MDQPGSRGQISLAGRPRGAVEGVNEMSWVFE